MGTRVCRRANALWIVLAVLISPAALAQVNFKVIEGTPLSVHVGADLSFQIFNAEVPGSGQIYPTSCENTADMGIFAELDGTLFSPDFSNHGCGTATGNLGTRTAWTPISISDVDGTGALDDPYKVTVVASAAGTAVQVRMVVTYANSQNFFRIKTVFTSFQRSRSARIWLGADIYLASSDAGVFHFEQSLGAPGGKDCQIPPTYSILLIPATAADGFTAAHYANVWSQIGQREVDDMIPAEPCQDNGAALQWDRVLENGVGSSIKSAVSFGAIPSAANFQLLTLLIAPPVDANNGDTVSFTIDTYPDEDLQADVHLWVGDLPEGFTAQISPSHIDAPGYGTAVLSVTVGDDVLPGRYIIPVHGSTAEEEGYASAVVNVLCTPPLILGRPEDQPESQTVSTGASAELSVTTARAGHYTYQWYEGASGSDLFPIEGATAATYTTPPITTPTDFWVRVRNACGSTDSWTATITPSGSKGTTSPSRRRGVKRGRGD